MSKKCPKIIVKSQKTAVLLKFVEQNGCFDKFNIAPNTFFLR